MTSIRDVAKLAGVSPATVSRVMNGTANVAEDKRQKVLNAIKETDFIPNEVARSLFKKSSKTIGFIIPSIQNPYFTQMADIIDALAKANGYRIILCNTGHDIEQERSAIQMLTALNADGIIIASNNNELGVEISQCNLPIVVIDSLFDTKFVSAYIYCDYYEGGKLAAKHLYECGCKNIVCIKGPQNLFSAKARYNGYLDFCREMGIKENSIECDYDFHAGMALTEELLNSFPTLDGIMACNDIVAISIYKILHKRNISVPDKIQLIGFDNIRLSNLMSPELTTISQPIYEMAQKAISVILNADELGKTGKKYKFPVSLIKRETTK